MGGLLNGRIWAKNRQRGGLNEFNGILFFWVGEGGGGTEATPNSLPTWDCVILLGE